LCPKNSPGVDDGFTEAVAKWKNLLAGSSPDGKGGVRLDDGQDWTSLASDRHFKREDTEPCGSKVMACRAPSHQRRERWVKVIGSWTSFVERIPGFASTEKEFVRLTVSLRSHVVIRHLGLAKTENGRLHTMEFNRESGRSLEDWHRSLCRAFRKAT